MLLLPMAAESADSWSSKHTTGKNWPLSSGHEAAAPPSATCAWLINGDTHSHHTGNINNAARALRAAGLRSHQIFAATEEPWPRNDVARTNLQQADLQGLLLQRDQLAGCLGSQGTLVIYLSGHGGPGESGNPENTSLSVHGHALLRAETLLGWIEERLQPAHLIMISDACYSGGFVRTFQRWPQSYTGMSPTDANHQTYCQPFSPLFWGHWSGATTPALDASFNEAISGCPMYRQNGSCNHGTYGCRTYRQRATHIRH